MIEILLSAPRLLLSALVGTLLGVVGAVALHHVYPGASVVLGAAAVAAGLVIGVVLGAVWEARRS